VFLAVRSHFRLIRSFANRVTLAGGYDAIWLLVCDPVDPSPDMWPWQRVEKVWKTRQEVSPLSVIESLAGGTRIEELGEIPGLSDAVQPL
jgi:phosphomevalonate kinase